MERLNYYYNHDDMKNFVRSELTRRAKYGVKSMSALAPEAETIGELDDPDLVEHNLKFIRDLKIPMWQKHMMVGFFMLTWKWFYYAPNTFKMLKTFNTIP